MIPPILTILFFSIVAPVSPEIVAAGPTAARIGISTLAAPSGYPDPDEALTQIRELRIS